VSTQVVCDVEVMYGDASVVLTPLTGASVAISYEAVKVMAPLENTIWTPAEGEMDDVNWPPRL
jgi:DNA mismatch repair protein MutH